MITEREKDGKMRVTLVVDNVTLIHVKEQLDNTRVVVSRTAEDDMLINITDETTKTVMSLYSQNDKLISVWRFN
jgi:hypothetical protein